MSTPTTTDPGRPKHAHQLEDEFTAEHHVYEPHKVGLPPIGSYVRELWRRREFAVEMARTNLRAQHFNTVFGQAWLIINPILLAAVYFVLVDILRAGSRGPEFFAHLVAGLFAYYFVQQTLQHGVKAVTSGGRLILNTAFPRVLLPVSSVIVAFRRFLPTVAIYVPVHIGAGLPIGWHLLWVLALVVVLVVLSLGLAMIVAALQVYFRDLRNFLPYVLRVWLYVSPVLYFSDEMPERYRWLLDANPLGQVLTAWSDVLNAGHAPSLRSLAVATAWALAVLAAGSIFFISREREFAVRL